MAVELKRLISQENAGYNEPLNQRTPEVEMDLEHYHHSIDK